MPELTLEPSTSVNQKIIRPNSLKKAASGVVDLPLKTYIRLQTGLVEDDPGAPRTKARRIGHFVIAGLSAWQINSKGLVSPIQKLVDHNH